MGIEMYVKEKFELSDGVTVLACSGYNPKFNIIGKQLSLMLGDEIRQTLTISGERKMLNQSVNQDLRAFEIDDTIKLSAEEAQSGDWQLVSE